jgi:hypothetical protein
MKKSVFSVMYAGGHLGGDPSKGKSKLQAQVHRPEADDMPPLVNPGLADRDFEGEGAEQKQDEHVFDQPPIIKEEPQWPREK